MVLLFLIAPGCQDYLFEQKCPGAIKEAELAVGAATPLPADIIFVVDNSGSMEDNQTQLAASFQSFIDEVSGGQGDYRMAVVTTDQKNDLEREGLVVSTFDTTSFWQELILIGGINSDACGSTQIPKGCFRGPQNARLIESSLDAATQIQRFTNNVQVGSCGNGSPEQGLKAMLSALDQDTASGCNEGFLRDNANLVIVIVADEDDGSCPGNDCSGVDSGLTAPTPIADIVTALAAHKNPSQVRVATVVGSENGVASDCSPPPLGTACGSLCATPPPLGSQAACNTSTTPCLTAGEACDTDLGAPGAQDGLCVPIARLNWDDDVRCKWCSTFNVPDCCSALSGGRYVAFALAMEEAITQANPAIPVTNCLGGGERTACLIETICQDDFGPTLARIARELVITNQYRLVPPAINREGVVVRVSGPNRPGGTQELVYDDDFVVSTDGVDLTIKGSATPAEGEEVEIFFVVDKETTTTLRGACID